MKRIKSKNKKDKQLEKFLKLIVKLPHEQYFGVVRILNVSFTEPMKKEEIVEEINMIEEELKNIDEENKTEENTNIAPVAMKNGDEVDIQADSSEVIEENHDLAAENVEDKTKRIEGMKNRLEKLKEEKEKNEEGITIQKFRTGEAIMLDTIAKFTELSSTKRKNLLAILKAGAY